MGQAKGGWMNLIVEHLDVRIEEINLENYDIDEIKILKSKERMLMGVNIYVPLRQQVNWTNLEQSLVDMLH